MSDQLPMFNLPILPDTDSAISSQESEAGRSPSDLPVPKTSTDCGPDHVHVSRFRSLDSKKAMPTNDTSGPLFTASSPSASRQLSLENRLRENLDMNGSPECAMTWKPVNMPSGPPICRLAASARRTGETASGLWRSPSSQEAGITQDRLVDREGNPWTPGQRAYDKDTGRVCQVGLKHEIGALWPTPTSLAKAKDGNNEAGNSAGLVAIRALAAWTTPSSRDHKDSPGMSFKPRKDGKSRIDLLPREAMALYPTPNAQDYKGAPGVGATERGSFGASMPRTVAAMWPTPMSQEAKHGPPTKWEMETDHAATRDSLRVKASGMTQSGSPEQTEKPGALNPTFVSWIMGYPQEWVSCAPSAMR